MRFELKGFQSEAADRLLRNIHSMARAHREEGTLSAVSLTAPTGSGKTVIAAAVIEALFFSDDPTLRDPRATVLWLSDSPSLNEQTMARFDEASDLLVGVTAMETVGRDFPVGHEALEPGHVYFLNRQLLMENGRLVNPREGDRTFYDVLSDTIEDPGRHLVLFIDEAHRGLRGRGTSDETNRTIYDRIVDGQPGLNPPMPCVVGISATPERFERAMRGRRGRDTKAPVEVLVEDVRKSGLIKDVIEMRTPLEHGDTRHQDLALACGRLARATERWDGYCAAQGISPAIRPLMVVQVENKIGADAIDALCAQVIGALPWLDPATSFANVFGEGTDVDVPSAKVPYCPPQEVSSRTEVRVLFAKDAISTGWDCPRAEVIYSRRRQKDPTYIAQLIGRMVRTPLARRVPEDDELNTVTCYLPEFDAKTVESVIARLKRDNVPVDPEGILANPVEVAWFEEMRDALVDKLDGTGSNSDEPASTAYGSLRSGLMARGQSDDGTPGAKARLVEALDRMPDDGSDDIRASFESIVTVQVRHDRPAPFLDLWTAVDLITQHIDDDPSLDATVRREFIDNIEGEIRRNRQEFERDYRGIRETTVAVKMIDPLTGDEFLEQQESVTSDSASMRTSYRDAIKTFSGRDDLVRDYVEERAAETGGGELAREDAIWRICAVAKCAEVVRGLEEWAEDLTKNLVYRFDPQSFLLKDKGDSLARWNDIKGKVESRTESTISVGSSVTRQNRNYDRYRKHVICDEEGWAHLKLNDLERRVVETELGRSSTIGWYRNQARNLNASLSIPYEMAGSWENMYPDFVFFHRLPDGRVGRTIVDPHGDWIGDSVAKLKGYVRYLREYPDMFQSVLAVTDERSGQPRYLDLMSQEVMEAIESFHGDTAKALFDDLGRPYGSRT